MAQTGVSEGFGGRYETPLCLSLLICELGSMTEPNSEGICKELRAERAWGKLPRKVFSQHVRSFYFGTEPCTLLINTHKQNH